MCYLVNDSILSVLLTAFKGLLLVTLLRRLVFRKVRLVEDEEVMAMLE